MISELHNLTSAVTYNPIPNAEPHPVDIAFITVADPGDLTLDFNISSSKQRNCLIFLHININR
jgi:hypothetical protein